MSNLDDQLYVERHNTEHLESIGDNQVQILARCYSLILGVELKEKVTSYRGKHAGNINREVGKEGYEQETGLHHNLRGNTNQTHHIRKQNQGAEND